MTNNAPIRLHYLQHVDFEGLGAIQHWAKQNKLSISSTALFKDEPLPPQNSYDFLIIMGGPMGIYDHEAYPWLITEKKFILEAIELNKIVLGICLGAQLIADVLGARVTRGPEKEIGWFPITRSPEAPAVLPQYLSAFHWHGDTFELPAGAKLLASSDACPNQGFIYNERVIALQFHLETTEQSINALIEHCGHELIEAPYIQSLKLLRTGKSNIPSINTAMEKLLDYLKNIPRIKSSIQESYNETKVNC